MSCMTDKTFIDTNILVYLSSKDEIKKNATTKLVYKLSNVVISTQVLGEFSNVAFRKKVLSNEKLIEYINHFSKSFDIAIITEATIISAITIKGKYKFSLWDSLIIASALETECKILYSEDMQHNQVIEGLLTIINPFKLTN